MTAVDVPVSVPDTTDAEVDAAVAAAAAAAPELAAASPYRRAELLVAIADALDAARDDLVAVAAEETALPLPRLEGEVGRTSGQLRLFAGASHEGSMFEVVLDSADPSQSPPRPDLRRMLRPLGPVVVFAASNFPFAFSVLGGDTASALAAGCPVVVKAHPGHPRLSQAVADLTSSVLVDQGWPAGAFAVVHGTAAGVRALQAPAVKAAGFTGSVRGGRALEQVAQSRPDPIPFYGELGSTNPVVVTPAAVAERGTEIAAGYVGSFTLGTGQFCTKPSVLFLPVGHGLDDALREQVAAVAATPMLTEGIRDAFGSGRDALVDRAGVAVLAAGDAGDGRSAGPVLLRADAATWLRDHEVLGEEVFGPLSLVVEYVDSSELLAVLDVLEGSLAATVHLAADDEPWVPAVMDALAARTGRLLVNGWPTGVAVTWAMQHGGPHPVTTNALHTSVGTTATRRWLRPVTYQSVPAALLPPALQDGNPWRLPRRVDGVLEAAPTP